MKGPSEDASEIRTDGTPTAVEGGKWFVNPGGESWSKCQSGLRMVDCSDMIYELLADTV